MEGDVNPISYTQKQRKIFLYKKADWVGLERDMSCFCSAFLNFQNDDSSTSINELWSSFKSELHNAVEKYIPFKQARKKNRLPYVDSNLRRLMRKRDKPHRKKDPRYRTLRHTVQSKLRAAYWKYVEDVVTPTNSTTDEAHTSNKRFWSLFKHAKSDPSGIPSFKYRGQLVSDAATKASVLNDTFYTAFTRCHTDSTLPSDNPHGRNLHFIINFIMLI